MSMIPQTLFMMNMFVDGMSFAGDVPTLSLPKLKIKTGEYQGGGMDAPIAGLRQAVARSVQP